MQIKKTVRNALAILFILMIPFVAMQLTDEVNWNLFDFVIAGVLLFGSSFAYEFIAKKSNNFIYKSAVGLSVATALLLVWINLAVGIIGNENNPANLMYFGVVVIGIIGAAVSGLKQRGMSLALFAMAIVQTIIPVIAFILWKPNFSPGVVGVFTLNSFFALMFIASGLLFRKSIDN